MLGTGCCAAHKQHWVEVQRFYQRAQPLFEKGLIQEPQSAIMTWTTRV